MHAGGQSWMGDAFEDAWELLKRRAMEPVLCADGGWREAQEEAAERLREVAGHFLKNYLSAALLCAIFVWEEKRVFIEQIGVLGPHQRFVRPCR